MGSLPPSNDSACAPAASPTGAASGRSRPLLWGRSVRNSPRSGDRSDGLKVVLNDALSTVSSRGQVFGQYARQRAQRAKQPAQWHPHRRFDAGFRSLRRRQRHCGADEPVVVKTGDTYMDVVDNRPCTALWANNIECVEPCKLRRKNVATGCNPASRMNNGYPLVRSVN